MKLLLFSLVFFLMLSCRHSQEITRSNESAAMKVTDKILFLNLLFTQDTISRATEIDLISYKITEGVLKTDFGSNDKTNPNSYRLTITDSKQNILKSIIFDNPLTEKMEYFNEDGTIGWTELKLISREFSLRLQLPALPVRLYISPIDAENFEKFAIFELNLKEY